MPVPARLVGMDFVAAANVFLPDRASMKRAAFSSGSIAVKDDARGRREAGPLCEGDEADLADQNLPDISQLQPLDTAS